MGNLVTLLSIEPPARYDGVPWTVVHLLEAGTPEVAGTVIDTQALPAPIDADPTDPAARNVSSALASLDIGWYRLVFEDAAGGMSPPSEPVRSSVLAAQLPPSPEQIRNRSPLLRQKFPEPATDPEQASDLRAAVYGATGQVMALSWRVIDPTLGCAAPEDYVCEVVPDALVEVALQAITAMSERRAVLADPEIAEQIGTGRRLRGFTAGPYSETYFAPGEFARRGVQSRPQFDQDDTVDSLLWDLATEDAKDYLVFRTSGTPLPSGLASTFDYRRASIGYRAGDDGYGGGGFARGGPDGL